ELTGLSESLILDIPATGPHRAADAATLHCYVCDPPAGSCGSAVCLREYHFVPQLMTWGDAQAFCRQEYTDLVALHGAEDVQLLLSTADYAGSAWIGLYNDWNVWRWSFNDNKSVPYLNWNSGEPNGVMELCVIMYTSGKWNDYGCFILSPFNKSRLPGAVRSQVALCSKVSYRQDASA
uniref:C-type lectin domain-containing protein n=1 Tax=Denticeps clupeoides TaxID=299321 RepID=A0AAY4DEU6_9TELE